MATTLEEEEYDKKPVSISDSDDDDDKDDDHTEDDDKDDDEEPSNEEDFKDEDEEEEKSPRKLPSRESLWREVRTKRESVYRRILNERISLRVHDVLIKGNSKTKDSLIEAEIEALKNATTLQEILHAGSSINERLHRLDVFDSVHITIEAGPPELPGTANVIIEVVETKNPLTGEIGLFTKPEARSWSLEGSLKLKNLLGYGDLWDGSLAYGWDQSSEVSAGVSLPRFKAMATPVQARISLLSQDWLKFSSYKERSLGMSLGLVSTKRHDLSYNLAWRTLTDPTQMSSRSIRHQLGHNLLSSLRYTYKVDKRNSSLRPTQGYAFVSTTQVGGLLPDSCSLRFLRQELDLRYALPLGFCHAALNFGLSGGVIFPWGNGFLNKSSYPPDRFFLGGNSSPICTLGSPVSMLGFKLRGLGPSEPRRQLKDKSSDESFQEASGMDVLGGDLAATAFADLSFDLPLKLFREAGIHGHAFACAGNLTSLTANEFRNFSFKNYLESFRRTVGFGIIVPTKLFRMEVNYCYILKQLDTDHGKTGLQFSFSSPS